MDLGNVRQNLANGAYNDPTEFTKDMRLMFSNSKSFNTNKRSRIYAMTLRLSAMFAERIKDVLTSWKRAMKQNRKRYKNGYACCLVACTMAGKSIWSKLINTHVLFWFMALFDNSSQSLNPYKPNVLFVGHRQTVQTQI